MKRIAFVSLLIALGLLLFSCNNYNQNPSPTNTSSQNTGNLSERDTKPKFSREDIEWANQYHLNIDTTKTYNMDIKVFQSLNDNECLAHEKADKWDDWYYGQILYYVSSDMVYDDKKIKEKAYLLGTYHYYTKDNTKKVVPFYCSVEAYKKNRESFEIIKLIQNYSN